MVAYTVRVPVLVQRGLGQLSWWLLVVDLQVVVVVVVVLLLQVVVVVLLVVVFPSGCSSVLLEGLVHMTGT